MKLVAMKSKVQELENVKDLVSKQAENEQRLDNERKKLLGKITELENDIIKRGKKAVEEREKLEFQVAELKVQCAKGVSMEERGKKRFEKKIRQLQSMVKQVEDSKLKIEAAYKEKIDKSISENKSRVSKLRSKLKSMEDDFRESQANLKNSERKRQEETNQLGQELGTLDATYAHLLVKHKNIVKNYTAEIESLEHKVSSTKLMQEQEAKHFNKKIEGLERKLRESTSVSLASKEKQSNEIDRLRSWNKELEARIVAIKTDYEAKEESINAEHTQQLEHLKQNMNSQTAEIDLLTKETNS